MTNMKPIIGFVAGLLTGSAVSYIFTASKLKKQHAQELNEVRVHALATAKKSLEDRAIMAKSKKILEVTEDGSIENPDKKPSGTIDISDFDERTETQYTNYAQQYLPPDLPVKPAEKPKPKKNAKDTPISEIRNPDKYTDGKPYPIDPNDYGDILEYDTVHLTLYSDNVLADDDGNIIEKHNLSDTVGEDFKEGFGDHSDDSTWIRNDIAQCDYEIEKTMEPYYGAD